MGNKMSVNPVIIVALVVAFLVIPNPVADALLGQETVKLSLLYSPEPVFASPITDINAQANVMAVKGKAFRLLSQETIQTREGPTVNPRMVAFINWVMQSMNLTITADIEVKNEAGELVFNKVVEIREYKDMILDVEIDRARLGDSCTVNLNLLFHIEYNGDGQHYVYDKEVNLIRVIDLAIELDQDGVLETSGMVEVSP